MFVQHYTLSKGQIWNLRLLYSTVLALLKLSQQLLVLCSELHATLEDFGENGKKISLVPIKEFPSDTAGS